MKLFLHSYINLEILHFSEDGVVVDVSLVDWAVATKATVVSTNYSSQNRF